MSNLGDRFHNWIFPICFIFTFLIIVRYAECADEKRFVVSMPNRPLLPIEDNFFCKALMGSSLRVKMPNIGSGIEGVLFKGTDEIAGRVEGKALYLLTRASFEAGDVNDESPFEVLADEKTQLVAVDVDRGRGVFVHVFSLNRETGVAVWSKTRSLALFTGNSDVQSYIMSCEGR